MATADQDRHQEFGKIIEQVFCAQLRGDQCWWACSEKAQQGGADYLEVPPGIASRADLAAARMNRTHEVHPLS